jgi:hypothetical protein
MTPPTANATGTEHQAPASLAAQDLRGPTVQGFVENCAIQMSEIARGPLRTVEVDASRPFPRCKPPGALQQKPGVP